MTVGKSLLAERAKPFGGEDVPPLLGVVPGSVALKGLHDPGQGGDPGHVVVANVPD